MKKISLLFLYKGNRNYVHGTDIFSAISQELRSKDCGFIHQLKFNFILRSNAQLLIGDDVYSHNKIDFSATGLALASSGDKYPLALIPLPNSPIRERYEYNEEEITDLLNFDKDNKSIELEQSTRYSLIEEIVAATKSLNNQLYPPPKGKWLFTGIHLRTEMPEQRSDRLVLKVSRRQMIANRFSKNEFYLNSDHFGTIEFSLGEP